MRYKARLIVKTVNQNTTQSVPLLHGADPIPMHMTTIQYTEGS
jgi:hypothetical protein